MKKAFQQKFALFTLVVERKKSIQELFINYKLNIYWLVQTC
jgi:hypothetical protein